MNYWELDHWMSFWMIIVAILSVVVSGVFSFLLYKVTRQSTIAAQASADAAAASTRIAENLEKKQQEKDAAFREQILIPIKNKASNIVTNLNVIVMNSHTVTDKFNNQELITLNIDSKYLAELPDNERNLINTTWERLHEFIKTYWIESGNTNHLRIGDSVDDQTNYRAKADEIISAMNKIMKLK